MGGPAMTFSIGFVRTLLQCVERAGVDRAEFLRTAAFDVARLDDHDGRISIEEYDVLQDLARDRTGDPAFALRMGEEANFAAFDIVPHLVAHASTLRDALEACVRFQPILSDAPPSTLSEKGDTATLRWGVVRSTPRAEQMRAELSLAGLMRLLRYFAGAGALPLRVSFEHAAPPHRAEYARIFGGRERFRQPYNGMTLDRSLLDREQIDRHPQFYGLLRSQAERELFRVRAPVGHADRLRRYLAARVDGRLPGMTAVARALEMSVRSLRRRLTEEGVSYRDLVDEARGTIAQRMLGDASRSIKETAHAMGFSDPRAFHRAFRRWTGTTPRQYREGLGAASR
jgi:AraC-like DNA-binding protein